MLGNKPSWRKDNKIANCLSRIVWLNSQNCKNRWIGMIKRDTSNSIKLLKIILIRNVVSVPWDDIKDWMFHLGRKELSIEFVDDRKGLINIFIPSDWKLKVSGISQSICSDRSEIRNHKVTFVNFSKPTSRVSFTFNCKFDSSLNNCNFFRMYDDDSIFCFEPHDSFLRNKKHVSVWIIKSFIFHWSVKGK